MKETELEKFFASVSQMSITFVRIGSTGGDPTYNFAGKAEVVPTETLTIGSEIYWVFLVYKQAGTTFKFDWRN